MSFLPIARAVRGRFPQTRVYGSGRVWANVWDVLFRAPSRSGHGRWADVGFVVGHIFFLCFLFDFFFVERIRPAASMRPSCLIDLSTSTGVRTGCHCLFRLSACVCVSSVVFTDCESCTTPISTNPVCLEAGEYGLTCGTWCFARRLEVAAVAGLMWVSWCVFGGAGFFLVSFFRFFFFFERTRPAASIRPPCPIYPYPRNKCCRPASGIR